MQQRIDTAKRFGRFSFDNLGELFTYLDTAPVTWGRLKQSHDIRAANGWDLGTGYKGAMELARDGWVEGAQRASEALEAFVPADPAPDTVTDFYGHLPHVARFCAGAPDSMIRHAKRATMGGGRILTLYVPTFLSAMVEAKCASNYGLGIAQYVNQLEQQGLRVEVHTLYVQRNLPDNWRLSYTVCVKHADQPLDLATLCFAIGHPAYSRRLGFALLERSPSPRCSSYGFPADANLSDVIDPANGAYILDGMNKANSTARTPADAVKAIGAQIEKAIEKEEYL